jgi:O-antigen/teichoic acid export membrane protein
LQKLFKYLIRRGYEYTFGSKMSAGEENFFDSLYRIGGGMLLATVFLYIFNVAAGRALGPSAYGSFMLTQSIAMFLYIPMLQGFNVAMVKYAAEKDDPACQRVIISSAFLLTVFFCIVSICLYLWFFGYLTRLIHAGRGILGMAIIFAFLFSLYTLMMDALRSLFKMKAYAVIQPLCAIMALMIFLVFIAAGRVSAVSAIASICLAYITVICIIIFLTRNYLGFTLDRSRLKQLFQYSAYAAVGTISFSVCTNLDKVLINKYLTISDVGTYSVYYVGSVNIMVVMAFLVFNSVFFPMASRLKDKSFLFTKINHIVPYAFLGGIPCLAAIEFVIFKCYGSAYHFDIKLALMFAVASIMLFVNSGYGALAMSCGKEGVKLTAFANIIAVLLNIFFNILLIPAAGMPGAVGSAIISYVIYLSIIFINSKKVMLSHVQ